MKSQLFSIGILLPSSVTMLFFIFIFFKLQFSTCRPVYLYTQVEHICCLYYCDKWRQFYNINMKKNFLEDLYHQTLYKICTTMIAMAGKNALFPWNALKISLEDSIFPTIFMYFFILKPKYSPEHGSWWVHHFFQPCL